ncbi:hypothetical protein ACN47E_005056 [Coniothyrium glycines]
MRWASRYTLQHRIPASTQRAHSSKSATTNNAPLSTALAPKPTLTTHAPPSNLLYPQPQPQPQPQHPTMGFWDSFSGSPRRRSSSARSYAGSSYSSSSRHHASTSRYKRSPRDGYLQHLYKKLQHFLREIWRYAQRHPYKVFFMVIMPLVSGGVLTKLARQFGVNLPETGGQASRGAHAGHAHGGGGSAGGYYGSEGYGYDGPSRAGGGGGAAGPAGLMGGIDMQSVAGGIGGLASLASMASKFM